MNTGWAALHTETRHRLVYPSEHVVRFLSKHRGSLPLSLLDIGAGSGRHVRLAWEMGFAARGVDLVPTSPEIKQGSMTELPFRDGVFDLALAYGVFYYGTRADHEKAIGEMWRVLKPGGHGFVCVRSYYDWRADGSIQEGEPEYGMEISFVDWNEIEGLYQQFTEVSYESTETTDKGRLNSDWLITVTK